MLIAGVDLVAIQAVPCGGPGCFNVLINQIGTQNVASCVVGAASTIRPMDEVEECIATLTQYIIDAQSDAAAVPVKVLKEGLSQIRNLKDKLVEAQDSYKPSVAKKLNDKIKTLEREIEELRNRNKVNELEKKVQRLEAELKASYSTKNFTIKNGLVEIEKQYRHFIESSVDSQLLWNDIMNMLGDEVRDLPVSYLARQEASIKKREAARLQRAETVTLTVDTSNAAAAAAVVDRPMSESSASGTAMEDAQPGAQTYVQQTAQALAEQLRKITEHALPDNPKAQDAHLAKLADARSGERGEVVQDSTSLAYALQKFKDATAPLLPVQQGAAAAPKQNMLADVQATDSLEESMNACVANLRRLFKDGQLPPGASVGTAGAKERLVADVGYFDRQMNALEADVRGLRELFAGRTAPGRAAQGAAFASGSAPALHGAGLVADATGADKLDDGGQGDVSGLRALFKGGPAGSSTAGGTRLHGVGVLADASSREQQLEAALASINELRTLYRQHSTGTSGGSGPTRSEAAGGELRAPDAGSLQQQLDELHGDLVLLWQAFAVGSHAQNSDAGASTGVPGPSGAYGFGPGPAIAMGGRDVEELVGLFRQFMGQSMAAGTFPVVKDGVEGAGSPDLEQLSVMFRAWLEVQGSCLPSVGVRLLAATSADPDTVGPSAMQESAAASELDISRSGRTDVVPAGRHAALSGSDAVVGALVSLPMMVSSAAGSGRSENGASGMAAVMEERGEDSGAPPLISTPSKGLVEDAPPSPVLGPLDTAEVLKAGKPDDDVGSTGSAMMGMGAVQRGMELLEQRHAPLLHASPASARLMRDVTVLLTALVDAHNSSVTALQQHRALNRNISRGSIPHRSRRTSTNALQHLSEADDATDASMPACSSVPPSSQRPAAAASPVRRTSKDDCATPLMGSAHPNGLAIDPSAEAVDDAAAVRSGCSASEATAIAEVATGGDAAGAAVGSDAARSVAESAVDAAAVVEGPDSAVATAAVTDASEEVARSAPADGGGKAILLVVAEAGPLDSSAKDVVSIPAEGCKPVTSANSNNAAEANFLAGHAAVDAIERTDLLTLGRRDVAVLSVEEEVRTPTAAKQREKHCDPEIQSAGEEVGDEAVQGDGEVEWDAASLTSTALLSELEEARAKVEHYEVLVRKLNDQMRKALEKMDDQGDLLALRAQRTDELERKAAELASENEYLTQQLITTKVDLANAKGEYMTLLKALKKALNRENDAIQQLEELERVIQIVAPGDMASGSILQPSGQRLQVDSDADYFGRSMYTNVRRSISSATGSVQPGDGK